MLRTRNNIDANKLVIFSGIVLYYGDTYIISVDYLPPLCSVDLKVSFHRQGEVSQEELKWAYELMRKNVKSL